MTDLNKLVEKLNESCKGSNKTNVWTREILLEGLSGCKSEYICYECTPILKDTLKKQIQMCSRDEDFKDCCYDCQNKCINHITGTEESWYRETTQFWTDEYVKQEMDTFYDYCDKCQINIDIKDIRRELKKPNVNMVEAIGDCLDLIQKLSDKIK